MNNFTIHGDGGWIVDSGASCHMSTNLNLLSKLRPTTSTPPITIGNGSQIPVTHLGQTTLNSANRILTLNDILVALKLVPNLISVRKLTTDNWVSIEFDPFGFTMKDLATQAVIARCNSLGHDASSSTSAAAFIASVNLWHLRLGHPNTAVVSHLLLEFSLPICRANHAPALCDVCQHGKHTRLPFSLLQHLP
jgi:hypothetical protein